MLKCTITSPLDKFFSEGLNVINIETVEGQRGILKNHIPLVAQLKSDSLVRLVRDKTELHIRVGQGSFFKFADNTVVILTQGFTKETEEFCPI